MKKLIALGLLMTVGLNYSIAQNSHSFGLSVGMGKGFIAMRALEGGPGYDLNASLTIGLNYFHRINTKLTLESGLSWYTSNVTVTPNFYPGIDRTPTDYGIQLLYVPLVMKVHLSNYFFIKGGLIGDVDVSGSSPLSSQTGMGTAIGLGGEFPVSKKWVLVVNPYVNLHGTIRVTKGRYAKRILDSGLTIGLRMK